MSISRQNLTIVIVSFKSEAVIHKCIKSINNEIKIIVIENSNNQEFKTNIEKTYSNVDCVLSYENLGMGKANNLGIHLAKTDYVLILNPDVILNKFTIDELFSASKKISDFAILAPISDNKDFPNYKLEKKILFSTINDLPFEVKSVDGFAMLFNKKKLNLIVNNKDKNYFDENIFMYLENDDLCKRIKDCNEKIIIVPKSKINHLGAKAVDYKYEDEVELSRNWHWAWSKFYYKKKHFSYLKAFIDGFPSFFSGIIKYLFFSILRDKKKQKKYINRASGFFNAALGRNSWYRPNINF